MSDWANLIQQLHGTTNRIVLSVTGGGSRVISELLSVPGASNTILEAVVPYATEALTEWLGRSPDRFCSRETALNMAAVAWCRATKLAAGDNAAEPMGVACTASLASSQPKRGDHRCWVAIQTNDAAYVYSLLLAKGHRDRSGEERVAAELILQAILEVAGILNSSILMPPGNDGLSATTCETSRRPDETVVIESEPAAAEIVEIVSRRSDLVWSLPDGTFSTDLERPKGLLSGSFNPLHHAHVGLADAAAKILDGDVYFELPIRNADKPPLDFFAIEDRRRQFTCRPVALTTVPLFVEKSEVFPNTVFVIGIDTAVRILDPRFYQASTDLVRESMRAIYRNGCRFLVASRIEEDGLKTLADLPEAQEFGDLFAAIPPDVFREDVSSTELRNQNSKR